MDKSNIYFKVWHMTPSNLVSYGTYSCSERWFCWLSTSVLDFFLCFGILLCRLILCGRLLFLFFFFLFPFVLTLPRPVVLWFPLPSCSGLPALNLALEDSCPTVVLGTVSWLTSWLDWGLHFYVLFSSWTCSLLKILAPRGWLATNFSLFTFFFEHYWEWGSELLSNSSLDPYFWVEEFYPLYPTGPKL